MGWAPVILLLVLGTQAAAEADGDNLDRLKENPASRHSSEVPNRLADQVLMTWRHQRTHSDSTLLGMGLHLCRRCDGCTSIPKVATVQRLTLQSSTRTVIECCHPCRHPARSRPLASAVREQAVVRAEVSQGTKEAGSFDVVEFRSGMARTLFQELVGEFQCPDMGMNEWSATVCRRLMDDMQGDEAMQQDRVLPIMAMKGESPCAAGFYAEQPHQFNTLSKMFRDAFDSCRGAGAAILCHLIRHSKGAEGQFTPLHIVRKLNEPNLDKYYASFGCTQGDGMFMVCKDPNPQRCESQVGQVFDADEYKAFLPRQHEDGLNASAHNSAGMIHILGAIVIGLFSGGGVAFAVLSWRRRL
eukprot:gnl/TRDRNA2_/TRDRNA2_27424_c0_seq2.p1 gnl/TRDRNA2_/TRDRNA2_27424_c0~~gnl/TRDRNA2_/TRDRNA2_27424_c0_seq2.p1  ORF type:complete len:357 (-),score=38.16 gnl/TRDRNA2_/TRDRNA2_27424_c0_seq2:135-1205(-)